jgi:hypothetical protein
LLFVGQEEEQRLEEERLRQEEEEQRRYEEEQLRLEDEARRAEEERLLQAIQVTTTLQCSCFSNFLIFVCTFYLGRNFE